MGEKKDLRRALEDERAISSQRERECNQLALRVRELEQQTLALALPAPELPERGYRLTTDPVDERVRDRIAKALGVVMPVGETITDQVILEAIERMRAPNAGAGEDGTMAYRRGETLADAVAHSRAEREDLLSRLTQATGVVTRIASALQVSEWNKDGDEIIEKAQRWSVFAHWLKKRHQDAVKRAELAHLLDKQASVSDTEVAEREAVVAELRTVLAGLVAEKDLAKYIQTRTGKVGGLAFQEATEPAPRALTGELWLDAPFTPANLRWFAERPTDTITMQEIDDIPSKDLRPVAMMGVAIVQELANNGAISLLGAIARSSQLSSEFCEFMNLIVLPALRRQRAATSQPAVH